MSLDEAHVDEEPSVDLAVVVDGDDVRVVQSRCGVGLATEPLLEGGVLGEMRKENLDGHHPIGARVEGPPDLSHTAAAQ